MNKEDFINEIALLVQKYAPRFGIKVVSPIIAQAILESQSGESELATQANNLFGLKYNPNQPNRCPSANGYYIKVGSEQNKDGSYVSSQMLWQKFESYSKCVKGYFEFLDYSSRYDNLKGVTNPRTYLELIKADGYATSLKYVDNLIAVIEKYNLTKYDNITEDVKKENVEIPNIIKCTSTENTTSCDRIPKYLVIHYTAGTSSKKGSALNIAKYFAKPTTKASADFIVDDVDIVQYNPNPNKYYCWSVGGSKYLSMTNSLGGKLYGIAKNTNCINIEMCSRKTNTKTLNATDKDWYFTKETEDNVIKLAKYLMDLYSIPIDNVITHNSVTGKICPNPYVLNEQSLQKWYEFKNRLSNTSVSTQKPILDAPQQSTENVPPKYYRVQCGAYSDKNNGIVLQTKLRNMGYNSIFKQVNGLWKLQVGAYSQKQNAEKLMYELKDKNINCFISYN